VVPGAICTELQPGLLDYLPEPAPSCKVSFPKCGAVNATTRSFPDLRQGIKITLEAVGFDAKLLPLVSHEHIL
jgi:hypothetical protein